MEIIQLLMIGIGLSMDAFAVSVCKGLCMQKVDKKYTFLIGCFFGGFQALMPFLGWALGTQFAGYITKYDHWIAFILLGIIGVGMLREAAEKDQEVVCPISYNYRELFMLAIATSIDALAVGITFAFLGTNIWMAITLIGCTTFVISILGVLVGNRFGIKYKSKAEIVGGAILILIGTKILLEHLGILSI
ncbi:MAG TPA: manganese efflux pump [Candidatus Egerieimonas intestinavium]|uniref:Putative manganese efflux pump MntP n=1 Tax=Candidatus Egerieimonas intestinavium TaxID=2840777 RepID=A0A9D1JFN7_9FIRM|nr:manganese efflux pump [Candidatus Egerieimonas intestinavium]